MIDWELIETHGADLIQVSLYSKREQTPKQKQ